jgi:cellulose 1,4-beta-cellobiosidase
MGKEMRAFSFIRTHLWAPFKSGCLGSAGILPAFPSLFPETEKDDSEVWSEIEEHFSVGEVPLYKMVERPSPTFLIIPNNHIHSSIIILSAVFALSSLFLGARAQLAGTLTTEKHPALTMSKCTASKCTTSAQAITIDANGGWLHTKTGYTDCYTGNTWNTTICPDGKTCAENCALDGADYSSTYGITTTDNALNLNFVTKAQQTNVGSRTYLMDSDTKYQMLQLLGQEFTFDVDVSNLPCGLNGALYFSEMDEDGGMSKYPINLAGAKYGTGYCDAQCPQDIKFIDGEVNLRILNCKQ